MGLIWQDGYDLRKIPNPRYNYRWYWVLLSPTTITGNCCKYFLINKEIEQ